ILGQSVIFYHFFHSGSQGSWCLSPTVYGREAGYTLIRSPVHRRAAQTHTGQTTMHSFKPNCNLEKPFNLKVKFLDCGRKSEYPERTHTCTGRTCKLHAERLPARSQTQDLLAAGQQCRPLHHCAAPVLT
ncbi:hypothetical protein AMECASPLE_035414, partial [Ameca splendens]